MTAAAPPHRRPVPAARLPRPRREPTDRERQVFGAYCHHHSRKLAAFELGISESTVRAHLYSLYGKLGVSDAFACADALGWLSLPLFVEPDCDLA